MTRTTDVLVLGASASGLATAASLRSAGIDFELLEAEDSVGAPWRRHYERLHLHTPKSSSALPGLPMPSGWPRYPAREQVVEYLERYRQHHRLEPHFGQRVTRLDRVDGTWVATTADGEWRAPNVVVATGAFRTPVRPTWPGMDEYRGTVVHSSEYRTGATWRGRPVLVIGFGNSACEQAIDLVECGAQAHMAVRSAVNVVPRDVFGLVPVLQLGIAFRRLPPRVADALAAPVVRVSVGDIRDVGLQRLPYGPNTQIAKDHTVPVLDIGTMAHLRAGRIVVHGDVQRFSADGVELADGSSLAVDAVVLATGFRPALEDFLVPWREVCDPSGAPLVSGRPTALPGLYFCGQFVSPAGMLREIGIEARRIAASIGEQAA